MRVLVTGAAGFVGTHLVTALGEQGFEVIAVDRPAAFERWPVPSSARIERAPVDLADLSHARSCLERARPDAVLHLAWYTDPTDYLVSPANLDALATSIKFVEAVFTAGCHKLVFAGTCLEYRERDRPLRETDPADPKSLYASSKHAAHLVTGALASAAGAELAWARIFHLHGPGEDRRRLIPWVAGQLRQGIPVKLTDGSQIRDQLHVQDVESGLIALLAPGASGVYNVCSGEPVTLREVLETVGEIVGRRDLLRFGARPHRPGEVMFLAGDASRLRGLGWEPRFRLRDGLADSLREAALRYGPPP